VQRKIEEEAGRIKVAQEAERKLRNETETIKQQTVQDTSERDRRENKNIAGSQWHSNLHMESLKSNHVPDTAQFNEASSDKVTADNFEIGFRDSIQIPNEVRGVFFHICSYVLVDHRSELKSSRVN
jgi:hypothetical protein